MRRRALAAGALVWLLLSWWSPHAWAQPYAAAGGFDRPLEGFALTRGTLAAARDGSEARVIVGDASGARLLPLRPGVALDDAASLWLARDTVVRGVAAADAWAGGPAAYAWFERDTSSGQYRYWWVWGDEVRLLHEAVQALDFALSVGPDGPDAWFAVPAAGGARLERHAWQGGNVEVVAQSDRSLASPQAVRDDAGDVHLAYLEGATIDTPIGTTSEWSVVYAHPGGARTVFDDALGPPATLALRAGAAGLLAWQRSDGLLLVSRLEGTTAAAPTPVGPGRLVGVTDDSTVYWTQGASLLASGVEPASGATAVGPAVAVAWSPYTVAEASVTRVNAVTHLVWAGTLVGGGGRILRSDDATPFQPTLRDRLAAWFGWTPWAIGEEAAGQLTGALLVGVLGTMVLLPFLWLLTLPLARRIPERYVRWVGAASAVAVLAALGGLAALRAAGVGNDASALLGGGWGFALALTVGLVTPQLLLSRADLELQPALLASAGLATLVSLSLMAFIAFQPWLRVLGL